MRAGYLRNLIEGGCCGKYKKEEEKINRGGACSGCRRLVFLVERDKVSIYCIEFVCINNQSEIFGNCELVEWKFCTYIVMM